MYRRAWLAVFVILFLAVLAFVALHQIYREFPEGEDGPAAQEPARGGA